MRTGCKTGPRIRDRSKNRASKLDGTNERTMKATHKQPLLATALVCAIAATAVPRRAAGIPPADSPPVALAKEEARAQRPVHGRAAALLDEGRSDQRQVEAAATEARGVIAP